jgi:hypothetical protein
MKKQEILQLLDQLPDDLDPEQLMHELYLKMKLARAEEAVAEGRTVSHEEVIRRTEAWFQ